LHFLTLSLYFLIPAIKNTKLQKWLHYRLKIICFLSGQTHRTQRHYGISKYSQAIYPQKYPPNPHLFLQAP